MPVTNQGKTGTDLFFSLIAAAIGNQDPRLLRDRDKACEVYRELKGQ
ncbi:hypothetical protein ATI45_4051 [Marinobacter sp. LV10MA510-1]|nr:hypothetical protein ATI45_4051 [Marinobacter sp. LV10MA510-1]